MAVGPRTALPGLLGLLLLLETSLDACGSSGTAPARDADPLGDGCAAPAGAEVVRWTSGGTALTALRVPAAAGADAATAVLAANESDETLCGWVAALPTLRRLGPVWLHDEALGADGVADVRALARRALAAGARRLLLVGASRGAKASLVAATGLPDDRLLGVVALSPEADLADGTPVLGRIRAAAYPTLLLVSRHDPYRALPACRAYAAARPSLTTLVVYPGADHGTALFRGASAARVRQQVLRFAASLSG